MDYKKKYIKYKSKYLKLSNINGGAKSSIQNTQIILFSVGHFGDIFLATEIVRNLVKCNPDLKISLWNRENCYYLYSNIDNIELLSPEKKMVETEKKQFTKYEIKDNKLFINIFYPCSSFFSWSNIYQCYSPYLIQNIIIKIINEINSDKKLNINFKYEKLAENQLIPKSKLSQIPESIKKQLITNKKLIFYYNITPRFFSNFYTISHKKAITKLCNIFKKHLIIVPKAINLELENLICLEKNGIVKKSDGENGVQYAQIARKCEHVIIYHSGICFPSLVDNNNKLYIVEPIFNFGFINLNSQISFFDLMKQENINKILPKRIILGKEIIKISI